MSATFQGYQRKDGLYGSRNYVAIIPSVFCVNEVAMAIAHQVEGCVPYCHHKGCTQLEPDLEWTTDALIRIGQNPNIGAILIVSLGCEGTNNARLVEALKETGKPVERIVSQELGGATAAIRIGSDIARNMWLGISGQQRVSAPLSAYTMGIKCGGSDTTSGLASNPVIGYVSDKIVDAGGKVIFSETTEFIGAEHILARRCRNPEDAKRVFEIVQEVETEANKRGVDMRKGQPTPGNIRGGISSIEEKSLGAIVKSGTRPIEGIIGYNDAPPKPGLWIKHSPAKEIELLSAMAIAGSQCILFSTGLGAPQGYPGVPVLKVCGNPVTFVRQKEEMDIDAGQVVLGNKSVEEVGEEAFAKLLRVLSGEATRSEAVKYYASMDIYTPGNSL
ncbi:MAG: UxaA family hydrolase [Fusobacteriaceae bacterium]|jgi:altronate dehydratase large subunit|nr:UxaA family hydrolase [Fusobacteriaceae bacterium]